MSTKAVLLSAFALGLSASIVGACTVDNPNHCVNHEDPYDICSTDEYCVSGNLCDGQLSSKVLDGCFDKNEVDALGDCEDIYWGDQTPDTDDSGSNSTTQPDDTETESSSSTQNSSDSSSTHSTSGNSTSDTTDSSTDTPTFECDDNSDCAADPDGKICVDSKCVECNGEEGCEGDKGVCDDAVHECVACLEDADCNENAEQSNHCLKGASNAENTCVDCESNDDCVELDNLPICSDDHSCQPCKDAIFDSSQCGEVACLVWDGTENSDQVGSCVGPDPIWVGKTDCSDVDSNAGKFDLPYCKLATALSKVKNAEPATIRIRNDGYMGGESVTISGNKVVAILGEVDGAATSIEMSAGGESGASLTVENGAVVLLSGLKWTNYKTDAIVCDSANLWMDWVTLDGQHHPDGDRGGSGLRATGCTVWANRLAVVDNEKHGIKLSGGTTTLVNSVVGRNGDSVADAGGINLSAAAELTLNYVTVAKNVRDGEGGNIACTETSTIVSLRNSLIASLKTDTFDSFCKDNFDAGNFDVEQSVTDDTDFTTSDDHKVLASADSNTVSSSYFENTDSFDFRLKDIALPLIEGVVTHEAGDPAKDFEGKDRPADGAADYPGADQPG